MTSISTRSTDVSPSWTRRALADAEEGVPRSGVEVSYAADMRYVGQAYELEVAIDAPLSPARVGEAVRGFHQAHERVYGYARTEHPVEFVNFSAVHRYPLPRPVLSPPAPAAVPIGDARIGERRAYFARRASSPPRSTIARGCPRGRGYPGRPSSSRRTPRA
jgi:N-methylhydantoinase A/oxoprolinase/acetone carboxylase beta subunit